MCLSRCATCAASAGAYERVLGSAGLRRLVNRPAMVGFGKKYPEFWLNARPGLTPLPAGHRHPYLPPRRRTRMRCARSTPRPCGPVGWTPGAPGPRQGGDDALLRGLRPGSGRQQARGGDLSPQGLTSHDRSPHANRLRRRGGHPTGPLVPPAFSGRAAKRDPETVPHRPGPGRRQARRGRDPAASRARRCASRRCPPRPPRSRWRRPIPRRSGKSRR